MRKRAIGIGLVTILLLVICSVRIIQLNVRFPSPSVETYENGQTAVIDNLEFTMKKTEVIDGEALQVLAPDFVFAAEADGTPFESDRLACYLAYLHIQNRSSSEKILNITSIVSESGAWNNGINSYVFEKINAGVSATQLKLREGEEIDLVLPYSMNDTMFRKNDWRDIQNRKFTIVLTYYPSKIVLI